ncbi:phosphate metabolism protein 7 [Thecaphora frezii]
MPSLATAAAGRLRMAALPLVALATLPKLAMAQEATQVDNNSTSTVLSAIILNAVIFTAFLCVFLLARPRFRNIYSPRTYLTVPEERVEEPPSSLFGWIPTFFKTPTIEIYKKNGLDAYMFVEYLEMMLWIFVPTWFLSWAVLMPTYAAGTSGGQTGFNRFTYANVGLNSQESKRLAAPLLLQYFVTFWILYNVHTRMRRFIKLRQEFLISPSHANTAQAKTVLLTGVPNELLSEKKLTDMYSQMPGGVARVWINRDLKELPDLFDERQKWLNKLEAAETKVIKLAYKRVKKGKVQESGTTPDDSEALDLDIAERYIEKKQRPTHKLGTLGCFGEKVDTLTWCRERIGELNKQIEAKRLEVSQDYKTYPPQNSAFILFNTQIAAHMAEKSHAHHLPYRMVNRYVEAHPNDIVWANLNMNPYERKVRTAIGWAITIGLIAFWTVPVGFVGIVSNINGLSENVPFLGWLQDLPPVVIGIIQGILPTVLLAVLNMLLPIFLRLLARLSGVPTRTGIELSLQTRFFSFQIIQNFLILTLISGSASQIVKFVQDVGNNPASFPGLLAQAIPKGSTFFLSFIALQGLSGGAALFAQTSPLVTYYVKKFLLASTPRKVWHIDHDMRGVAWGTLFPSISLITVIGLGYLVIAPILNGFTAVTFLIFYVGYRYLFLYVYDTRPESETSGLFFPKAISHMMAGLYVEMVMLCALFFLSQYTNADGSTTQSAIPEGALMVVLIVLVAGYHYILNDSFKELYTALPLSLVSPNKVDREGDHGAAGARSSSAPAIAGADLRVSGETSTEKKPLMTQAGGDHDAPAYTGRGDALGVDLKNLDQRASTSAADDEDLDKAFMHPAVRDPQRPVWIPNDKFGIGRAGAEAARKAGVEATTEKTSVDEKGHVQTDAYEPPGEPRV